MKYRYITIPNVWVTEDTLKSLNINIKEHRFQSNKSKAVFISYVILNDIFVYSTHVSTNPKDDYLCNSETEFLEKVQEAKLMRIL